MANRLPIRLTGISASSGTAAGPAFRYGTEPPSALTGEAPTVGVPEAEAERFAAAVEATRRELEAQLATLAGEPAAILRTHLLMLDDPLLVQATAERIHDQRLPAEAALQAVVDEIAAALRGLEGADLQSRAADVQDVGRHIRRQLLGLRAQPLPPAGAVVVAADLAPSDVLKCAHAGAAALALEVGAVNSHAAILARSLGLPAVVGVKGLLAAAVDGLRLLVNGDAGEVILSPDEVAPPRTAPRPSPVRGPARTFPEARTADGRRVHLYANVGQPEELEAALAAGAEGVGVLRTEFLFMQRRPGEDEQYAAYSSLARRLQGRPLVVRTLDVGGDKPLPYLPLPVEANPFLGLRGLRLSLAWPDLFLTQLRAILRAAAHGDVRLMYPMVTDVSELARAGVLLEAARAELAARGGAPPPPVPAGAMIEVPAAAIGADWLCREAAFLSVGTNDLAQYALAADRTSPAVAAIYSQSHPAVLRLLQATVQGARRLGRPVAVCGELAADPEAIPLLVGLGVDELSVAPHSLELVRRTLAQVDSAAAAARAASALAAVEDQA